MNARPDIEAAGFMIDVRQIRRLGRVENGQPCACCMLDDERLHALNILLLQRISFRDIARQFDLHHMAVFRHHHRHLMPEVLRLLDKSGSLLDANLMSAERVIADLGAVRRAMAEISVAPPEPVLDDDGNVIAHSVRDHIQAAKSLHSISRTALELTGHLRGNQTNVAVISQGQTEAQIAPVLDAVMTALADHPEAALAVAEALGQQPETIEARALPVAE